MAIKIKGDTVINDDKNLMVRVYENINTFSADYTVTTNSNALSIGPLTVNSDVTITVPNGSTWLIL